MSKITKQEQIEELLRQKLDWRSREWELTSKIDNLEEQIEILNKKIQELYIANDTLTHTPEFAADTTAAFNRGRQDAMRVLSRRSNSDITEFANEIYHAMNELVNKYTRTLTSEVFIGIVEPSKDDEPIKDLPKTEFTEDLLKELSKVFTTEVSANNPVV